MDNQLKWDLRFLELAKLVSTWSKDSSTKVGSVIADNKNRMVSIGYNGFPRGIGDTKERLEVRETKYALTIHAERNAIAFANRWNLEGCTIYVYPLSPCSVCAGTIIQEGISRVVFPPMSADVASRWDKDCKLALEMFAEVGIKVDEIDVEMANSYYKPTKLEDCCDKYNFKAEDLEYEAVGGRIQESTFQTCIYCGGQFPVKSVWKHSEIAVVYCSHCLKMQSPNPYKLHPGC